MLSIITSLVAQPNTAKSLGHGRHGLSMAFVNRSQSCVQMYVLLKHISGLAEQSQQSKDDAGAQSGWEHGRSINHAAWKSGKLITLLHALMMQKSA